jgi:hypothetical protein
MTASFLDWTFDSLTGYSQSKVEAEKEGGGKAMPFRKVRRNF